MSICILSREVLREGIQCMHLWSVLHLDRLIKDRPLGLPVGQVLLCSHFHSVHELDSHIHFLLGAPSHAGNNYARILTHHVYVP